MWLTYSSALKRSSAALSKCRADVQADLYANIT